MLSPVSALREDTALRATVGEDRNAPGHALPDQASPPRAARLALEGLKLRRHLEFHDRGEAERVELQEDIVPPAWAGAVHVGDTHD
ncbi:hypothetical protein [Roseivivax sediminis]|uniref:Uncharacterized protein n=1 Tax=Roseivivax sediminis TaxID=936889 RepID=A0A1I1SZK9_9RHOB|nr:hypothetical protein [Roseivivax sediminis]SFD50208.1 hypothetical protein SAMN04515678_101344 [Roseivivax sediminis]